MVEVAAAPGGWSSRRPRDQRTAGMDAHHRTGNPGRSAL